MSWKRDIRLTNTDYRFDIVRKSVQGELKERNGDYGNMRILKMWEKIAERFTFMQPAYGVSNKRDFGMFADLIAHMFAYDNKHYYVYRAIKDSSKIGFLSRKQYYKLMQNIHVSKKLGYDVTRIKAYANDYCREYGTMASAYRLFKGALIENNSMRFFKNIFNVTDEHERKITNDEWAQHIIKILTLGSTPITLEETDDIQACYDINLPDSYEFSDKRYCTHSCMERSDVADFYHSFPVKGVIVRNNDDAVGRFLLWTLPNGVQYVDRLYVRAAFAKTALAAIDRKYPEAIKYPALTDKSENPLNYMPLPFFAIPIKNVELFANCDNFAWVDTFAYVVRDRETDEYYIANTKNPDSSFIGDFSKYKFVYTMRGGRPYGRKICPECGKLMIGACDSENTGFMHELLHCKSYKPKGKKEPVYVALIKDYLDTIGGKDNDGKNRVQKEFFSVLKI